MSSATITSGLTQREVPGTGIPTQVVLSPSNETSSKVDELYVHYISEDPVVKSGKAYITISPLNIKNVGSWGKWQGNNLVFVQFIQGGVRLTIKEQTFKNLKKQEISGFALLTLIPNMQKDPKTKDDRRIALAGRGFKVKLINDYERKLLDDAYGKYRAKCIKLYRKQEEKIGAESKGQA